MSDYLLIVFTNNTMFAYIGIFKKKQKSGTLNNIWVGRGVIGESCNPSRNETTVFQSYYNNEITQIKIMTY